MSRANQVHRRQHVQHEAVCHAFPISAAMSDGTTASSLHVLGADRAPSACEASDWLQAVPAPHNARQGSAAATPRLVSTRAPHVAAATGLAAPQTVAVCACSSASVCTVYKLHRPARPSALAGVASDWARSVGLSPRARARYSDIAAAGADAYAHTAVRATVVRQFPVQAVPGYTAASPRSSPRLGVTFSPHAPSTPRRRLPRHTGATSSDGTAATPSPRSPRTVPTPRTPRSPRSAVSFASPRDKSGDDGFGTDADSLAATGRSGSEPVGGADAASTDHHSGSPAVDGGQAVEGGQGGRDSFETGQQPTPPSTSKRTKNRPRPLRSALSSRSSGRSLAPPPERGTQFTCCRLHPNGRFVAVGTNSLGIAVFSMQTSECICVLGGFFTRVTAIRFDEHDETGMTHRACSGQQQQRCLAHFFCLRACEPRVGTWVSDRSDVDRGCGCCRTYAGVGMARVERGGRRRLGCERHPASTRRRHARSRAALPSLNLRQLVQRPHNCHRHNQPPPRGHGLR